MDITVPKKRDVTQWQKNQERLRRQDYQNLKRDDRMKFKDYCELGLLFLDADDKVFLDNPKFKSFIEILKNPPKIVYALVGRSRDEQSRSDDAKNEDMIAERIVKALAYGWKNIVDLITGRSNSNNDPMGIYNEENINLQFARMEKMLTELQNNRFRVGIYAKENAYIREMMEKEIEEEVVFIKLLQSILQAQTRRIQEARKGYVEMANSNDDEEVCEPEPEEQKLPKIQEILKVSEYFQRKLASLKEPSHAAKDAIDRQQETRRFNAAAIRYHLHTTHVRRS